MRATILAAWLLITPSLFVPYQASAQAGQQDGISFSLSFLVGQPEGQDGVISHRHCLADSFKPQRKVVLINKSEMCSAKTGSTFIYEQYGFEATRLTGSRKCLIAQPGENHWRFKVAVVGIDRKDIRLISPRAEQPVLPKYVEAKLLKLWAQQRQESAGADENSATVTFKALKVGKGSLVMLAQERGPIAWLVNNKIAVLEGDYASEHIFFSVRKKLYLAYTGSSCRDCGQPSYYIYDLSGNIPKKVYENGKLYT